MTLTLRSALIGAIATLTACGGGGGSSNGGVIDPSPSPLTAAFQADQVAPNSSQVAMLEGSKSGDVVTVKVTVTGVSGIYGAAFEVSYDSNNAAYVNYSPGSLFEQGGQTPNYTVSTPSPGRVVVGISRVGSVTTTGAGTTATAVNLTFRVKNSGSSRLDFEGGAALLDGQIPNQPLAGISWFGGSLQGF